MQSTARVRDYCPRPRPFPLLLVREDLSSDAAPPPELQPETATWTRVHERLLALGKERAAHERDLCRWLLAAQRLAVHVRAGYASLREYAERLLGLNTRQTEERLRVARALADLPALDRALASGELPWSAARELTRVATRETETEWLRWAKNRRVHQIEKAVAARRPGDAPTDRADPSQLAHRLSFQVRPETLALFRDLQAAIRADLGGHVDDDTLLYEVARRALGGPTDEGRASYQLAVTRCDDCGRTSIDAAGQSHPVDDFVAEMAACDAQALGSVAAVVDPQSPHVGADRPRATQTIPPATRRAVLRRDHKRCVVPGCNNHRFLDVHHIDLRSEGGGHEPERLAVLCGAHHRAVHAGILRIDGSASTGFVVHHADASPYGAAVDLPVVQVAQRVLGTLEHMGFKTSQARSLVDKALSMVVTPNDAALLLQAALRAS